MNKKQTPKRSLHKEGSRFNDKRNKAISDGSAPQGNICVHIPGRPGREEGQLLAVNLDNSKGSEALGIHHPQGIVRPQKSRSGGNRTTVPGEWRKQQPFVSSEIMTAKRHLPSKRKAGAGVSVGSVLLHCVDHLLRRSFLFRCERCPAVEQFFQFGS